VQSIGVTIVTSRPLSRLRGNRLSVTGVGLLCVVSLRVEGPRYLLQYGMRIAVFGYLGGRGPCFSPVPALLSPCYLAPVFARKVIWIRALAKRAGENARYQAKFAVPALSAPAENAGLPRPLRPVCCKSAAFAAKPPSPAGPPGTIGTGARSVRLQIRCKCSQTGALSRSSGRAAILVAPLRATTSERRLFGERR